MLDKGRDDIGGAKCVLTMIKTLETEANYDAALKRIEQLMNAEHNTPEGEELDALVDLVEAYEDRHYPIGGSSRQ